MKHLAPFKIYTLTILLIVVTGLFGCASQSNQTDASVNPQKRREFEELKYRDTELGRIPAGIQQASVAFASKLPGAYSVLKQADVQSVSEVESIGPWNIGGRTRTLKFDVTNPDILIAGAVSGGVWRSKDAGSTWVLRTKPNQLHSVTSLAQDVRNGKTNIWYYGTGEVYGNSAQISGNGIWKSTNSGKDWLPLTNTLSNTIPARHAFAYTWRVAVNPVDSLDEVYVATAQNGIYRSTDGGATFIQVLASDAFFSDILITPQGVMYVALSSFTGFSGQTAAKYGLFRSTDGATWTDISPSDMKPPLHRIVFNRLRGTKDRLFVLAETPGVGARGVFQLRDGTREQWHSLWKYSYVSGDGATTGGSWENRSENIPLLGGRNGDFFSQGGYDLLVKTMPTDTNVVIVGGTNLYRNSSGFKSSTSNTWIGGYGLPNPIERFPTYPNHHPDQHDLIFDPVSPLAAISVNDGGVMRTDNILRDTVQWTDLNRGYLTTQHYAIAISADSADSNVMGGMQDNGTWATNSNDAKQFWRNRNGGDGAYCYFADSNRTLYVATQTGRIRRVLLDAAGEEIARTRVDPQITPDDYLFINPYAIDPNHSNRMYQAGGQMMWRNNDVSVIPLGRDDSTNVNWDSLPVSRTNNKISAVAVSKVPADIVWYGTVSGKVYRMDNASTDQPVVKDVSSGLPLGLYLNNITIDQRDANHVLATFSNYGALSIFSTTNGGANWTAISGNLEEQPSGGGSGPAVNWTAILPYSTDRTLYFAAASTGLYAASELNGMSTVWFQVGAEEIGNVPVDMVLTRASDKTFYVGTHGRGVFKGRITQVAPPPQAPLLSTPYIGTRGVLLDTVLSWHPVLNAVSYTLELATDSTFSTVAQSFHGLSDTSKIVRSLEQGANKHFWRVAAFGIGGKGAYSDAWSFSTALLSPVLLSPPTNTQGITESPVQLIWASVNGASSYDVELSTVLTFSTVVASKADVTDTTFAVYGLESGKRYYWHVRSNDLASRGVYSQRSSFVTGTLSSVQEEETTSEIFFSSNPASTTVTVSCEVCAPDAMVDLVNLQGKIVASTKLESGSTTLNISALPVGSYTVRISWNKQSITRLLIKD